MATPVGGPNTSYHIRNQVHTHLENIRQLSILGQSANLNRMDGSLALRIVAIEKQVKLLRKEYEKLTYDGLRCWQAEQARKGIGPSCQANHDWTGDMAFHRGL